MCYSDAYHWVKFDNVEVYIVQGDILAETTSAIVNAPNHDLQRKASLRRCQDVFLECGGTKVPKWKDGELATTKAPHLLRRRGVGHVLHACTEVYGEDQLHTIYRNIFRTASDLSVTTLSLPTIGGGAHGLPKETAARILFEELVEFLFSHGVVTSLQHVRIINPDGRNVDIAAELLESLSNSDVGQRLKQSPQLEEHVIQQ
eukprot:PhM_4_TR5558/c0_g1_i1/m.2840